MNKLRARLIDLRMRRREESGNVELQPLIVIGSIMITLSLLGALSYAQVLENSKTQAITKEATVAYEMIYESYSARAESIDDKGELDEALEKVTENYRLARDDEALYVTSEATGEDGITVAVSRRDGDSNVVFNAKFTTGDEEPSTSKDKLSEGNDVRDLEGVLGFE